MWKCHFFIQSWEIFREKLSWGCMVGTPKPALVMNSLFKLGHLLCSLSSTFPTWWMEWLTSSVTGRKEAGQAHLNLFPRMPVPPIMGTQAVRCPSVYPFIRFSVIQQVFGLCWTQRLMCSTIGDLNSTHSCVSCRCRDSKVCNSSCHFNPLSLFPFLHREDSVFPTNHCIVWSSNEIMYGQPLPKSEELDINVYFPQ